MANSIELPKLQYYKLEEIVELIFLSKSKVKYIIKKMGLVPVKRGSQNQVYYDTEQIELIKEDNPFHYEKFGTFNSQSNHYTPEKIEQIMREFGIN